MWPKYACCRNSSNCTAPSGTCYVAKCSRAMRKRVRTDVWRALKPGPKNLRLWQAFVLVLVFVVWHALTKPGFIPPFVFENDRQAAFFFGEPLRVLARIWAWFFTTRDIYGHLAVTLVETVLAFVIGTAGGLAVGMWLALSPVAAAIFDPYIQGLNSMPRVILAPIFAVW